MDDSGKESGGDAHVQWAFALGWNMAQLFHGPIPTSTPDTGANAAPKLPGIGDLDDLAKARLLLSEVVVGVRRVCTFEDVGLPEPDLRPVAALLDAPTREPDRVRLAIAAMHRTLLVQLTAANFRLGKAYGLGRALAETTMLPSADDRESFTQAFAPFRLGTLESWLSDLKSLLPPHATEGVRGSMRTWASWVAHPAMELWSPATGNVEGRRPVDWASAEDQLRINRALGRQAQVWRAMLSGEKAGVDLLSTAHYVEAGEQLVDQLGDMLRQYFWRFKWVVLAAVVVVAAVVGVVAHFSLSSAVLAYAATAIGAIGLSWKGVGGTLGKALSRAEKPLWDTALDKSIVIAATRLPQEVRHDGAARAA